MGLIKLLLRLFGILLLAAVVSAAWLYRGPLWTFARGGFSRRPPTATESVGHPGAQALARARDKVDSLNGWKADSVVLGASEMASLIGAGLDPAFRSHLDSLTVLLGDDELGLSALLATSIIPRDLLGPLAGMLNPKERIAARGSVAMAKPGVAQWTVREFRVRDFPLPDDVARKLVQRGLNGSKSGAIMFDIPDGVQGIRVRPGGVTLYGGGKH